MSKLIQREELGAFLRSRREATDPDSVGIEPGSRRRTPGLRREELAQLSGLSATWYTWLEQGRDIAVSRPVVNSLARTLRLSPAERAHLFTLAGLALPTQSTQPRPVDPLLRRLVDDLLPKPAYVMNHWWDVLVYNDAYAELLGGLDHRPEGERNILWITFTESRATGLFVDWVSEARTLLGQFRVHLARYPDDARGAELLRAMQASGTKFSELWEEHHVAGFVPSHKRLSHEAIGRLDLDYLKLAVASDESQALIVFFPSDAASAAKLERFRPELRPALG